MAGKKRYCKLTLRLAAMCEYTAAFADQPAAVLWLQGCLKNCRGCMAPEWRILNKGKEIDIQRLVDFLLSLKNITMLVVSGGEPMLQSGPLKHFVQVLKNNSSLGLMLYTGYSDEELSDQAEKQTLLNLFDIVVTGPYLEEENNSLGLRGSTNQNIHIYNSRYYYLEEQIISGKRRIEVEVSPAECTIIGIPPRNFDSQNFLWRAGIK